MSGIAVGKLLDSTRFFLNVCHTEEKKDKHFEVKINI